MSDPTTEVADLDQLVTLARSVRALAEPEFVKFISFARPHDSMALDSTMIDLLRHILCTPEGAWEPMPVAKSTDADPVHDAREVVQYDTRIIESHLVHRTNETLGVWPAHPAGRRVWALALVSQFATRACAKDLDSVEQLTHAADQVIAWVNGEVPASDGSAS